LPAAEARVVLEDEKGVEFDTVYIGSRTGLSGGWRGFAMHHNLEDGDALVFELTAPDHFKVLINISFSDFHPRLFFSKRQKKTNLVIWFTCCHVGTDSYCQST
jgi:B3 DNA binding domain